MWEIQIIHGTVSVGNEDYFWDIVCGKYRLFLGQCVWEMKIILVQWVWAMQILFGTVCVGNTDYSWDSECGK